LARNRYLEDAPWLVPEWLLPKLGCNHLIWWHMCPRNLAYPHKLVITRTLPGGGILRHACFILAEIRQVNSGKPGESTGVIACTR
jgi:hypothetical protein